MNQTNPPTTTTEIKLVKDTGRTLHRNGVDWPITHVLRGTPTRGYTVEENVCGGDASISHRHHFYRIDNARRFFDGLPGTLED